MKFRTKHMPQIGFFGQVKVGFLDPWETIQPRSDGFWLARGENLHYPLSSERDAIDLCKKYRAHIQSEKLAKTIATYTYHSELD